MIKRTPLTTILFVMFLSPTVVLAEGAHRYFDCTTTLLCNETGACEAASDSLTFHLAPLDAGEDGSGNFMLSYQDQEVVMQALSDAGPYIWRLGNDRHTLLASSETAFLWHQLILDGRPESRIRYLHCELRY